MKYPKADYETLVKCPECGFHEIYDEGDEMPNRDAFNWRTDENGDEYTECPCGCKFSEE